MLELVSSFSHCFKTNSAHGPELAARYVGGLLSQTQRKNMERMNERLGEAAELGEDIYQATQNFISASHWEVDPLFEQLCAHANRRLGGSPDSVLAIDESAQSKKGDKSVGVGRQHNGRLGKQDNCQTGVYSALNCGTQVALVGARLFLPEDWIKDPERCRKAGVPEERIGQGFLTKIDQAKELILEAIKNGVQFSCVAVDAFYGRDSKLRRFMEEKGLIYCVDVPTNARVFEAKPTVTQRPKKITQCTISAAELAVKLMAMQRHPKQRIDLREGDHGIVEAHFTAVRVWEWAAESSEPTELWCLVRAMPDGSHKLSFCNASARTPLKQLARWQAGRFWVERCFQDAKSHCGMGQYQARGWWAWHHHMALVSLAVLFQMEERLMNPTGIGNLTATDVTEMIEWVLITKPTEADLLARMKRRHRLREKSKQSALECQRQARREKVPKNPSLQLPKN
jgi:SRSO17 transposase